MTHAPNEESVNQNWEWNAKRGPRGNLFEAVAVFDSERNMQEAVDDLEANGFSNAAMSRPASPDEIAAVLRHPVHSVEEIEDDARVPREAYVDPDSRTSGLMILVLVPVYILLLVGIGFAVANGMTTSQAVLFTVVLGILGAVAGGVYAIKLKRLMTERVKEEKALGGLVLWVRLGNKIQESKALDILRRHRGRDVHVHGSA